MINLDQGYFLVYIGKKAYVVSFADTPCYKLHKTLPDANWYKEACVKVARIFKCIDSTLRIVGGKTRSMLKRLPDICNNINEGKLVKRSIDYEESAIEEQNTLDPIRL